MTIFRKILAISLLATLPVMSAQAFDLEHSLRELASQGEGIERPDLRVAQGGGKSLAEAIDSVRRKTDGRIVSAETRRSGKREVHHIKVLTKDGKVKTFKIQGRKLGDG